jgi:hypothetical protein
MKITEGQLRQIIREEVRRLGESDGVTSLGQKIYMGGLYAQTPYDERYSDTLKVEYDPGADRVVITVSQTAAAGGMDSFTGSRPFDPPYGGESVSVSPDPASIMDSLQGVIQNPKYLFKAYGKPTKNFTWVGIGPNPRIPEKGLSRARVKMALDRAVKMAQDRSSAL